MAADIYLLDEDQCRLLGVTPAQARQYATLAREIGPLSADQRDRIAILLRATPDRR